MAYVWGRPNLSPPAQNQFGIVGTFAFDAFAVPPQFAAEVPCPLYVGCNPIDAWQWFDPVYNEYRDVNFPQMGAWPPPQPDTDPAGYAAWVNEQRQWMPYEVFAYNGVQAGDACADTRGRPEPEFRGHAIHFDFTSNPDWAYVTSWNGVRLVAQVSKHQYITNEGTCGTGGPVQAAFWVKKSASAYPTPPTWGAPTSLIQSFELDDFGIGSYRNPYGFNILDAEFETALSPNGTWDIADVDRYWFHITQTIGSAYGNANGTNNGSLAVHKVWAAAIVNLGGTPTPSAGTTAHTAVVG